MNKVKLVLDPTFNEPSFFNHILFDDKYIYIIQDLYLKDGLNGSYEGTYLTNKFLDGSQNKMTNFLIAQRNKVTLFCQSYGINIYDNFVFNVFCYNSSLTVPKSLKKKEFGEWLLPLNELIKTIKISENDDVKSIRQEQMQSLLEIIKKDSDSTKSFKNANLIK